MTGEPPAETSAPDPTALPEVAGEPVPSSTAAAGRGARGRGVAIWLAALLVVVVAGVLAAPFWAPWVTPLLPWHRNPATDRERALTAGLAALQQQNAALRSAQGVLSHRLGESLATIAGLKSEIAALGRRIDAVAAQKAAQPVIDPATVHKLQQQVAGIDRRAGDLAARIAALETRMAAPARAPEVHTKDREAALLVALLQMRERLDAGRPFAAPYAAFLALAQGRPQLLAAAAPLAPLARDGVARRAALARDFSRLAGAIATAHGPAAANDWSGRILDQLRRLVTIRRIGGRHETPAEAAVARAQADLARGDLAAAVPAIAALSGPPAAAARPWLAAARRRLAAETALARLQQQVEAGIARPAAPASPAAAPDRAPPPGPHS